MAKFTEMVPARLSNSGGTGTTKGTTGRRRRSRTTRSR